MKRLRYILGGLTVVLIVIQFIPTNLPDVTKENPKDLLKGNLVSQDVAQLIKTSCYSCHSNETQYPWYSLVAPVSWLVARDVREGREELNFSNWSDYDLPKMLSKLEDIGTEVGEGHMPMPIYTFMHPSTKLDDTQRKIIVTWAEAAMDSVTNAEDEEEN